MDQSDLARRDLSSLRCLTHIGASAPPVLRRRARERFGAVLAHVYGASEMGLVSILPPAEYDLAHPGRLACAGRVQPGVEVRFRRDDGTLADPGEAGGIEVRSPAMAGGYHHRPAQQAAAFEDGWYRSGDLGFLDAVGYLHILGRAVDIIRIDGTMVSPTLVEETLCRLPDVRYAVTVVDQETGAWVAAVVPWPGLFVDRTKCLNAIAAQHGPTAVVILPLARVPLTEQGKPDREAIRQLGREAAAAQN
jgi:fatty-acyl-CoA synthase